MNGLNVMGEKIVVQVNMQEIDMKKKDIEREIEYEIEK